jgi:exocyst complex component 4
VMDARWMDILYDVLSSCLLIDNYDLYDESEVWTAIQQVLRDLLEIYLAVDEDKPQTSMSAFSPFTISSHGGDFLFIKKKLPTKARKQPLFRFDNSRHAISVSSYIKEQRDKELVSQVQTGQLSAKMDHHFDEGQPSMSQHIVCKPSIRNITVMYSPVKEFILKIEDALNQPAGFHCDLYQFLLELVEHKFLDSIQLEYQEQLANSTKPEAKLAITVDLKLLRGTNKPALFSSAMLLVDILKKLQQLITDMPMYSANFLSLMLELLQKYIETCSNTFKDYSSVAGAQSPTSDKVASLKLPTISSKWAQSDDIIHLVTDLPSWQSSSKRKPTHVGLGKNSVYEKESNTLLFKLSPEIKQRSDIVHSPENLKYLSILHESTDWLYNKLVEIKDHLQGEWIEGIDGATFSKRASKRNSNSEQQAILDNERQTIELINQFTNCLGELQSISQTAIIMLHLEIRCHCFYYLTPALNQSSYVCEHEVADVESGVKELGNDLRDLKLVTAGVLSLDKQNYLFDGLGHLIATVFINSTSYLKKININGVKKMCRNIQHIQSCLSKITSIREKDLDLAQKYFAMLYVNEEEFLKLVMEQGKVFDQKDYINALKLLSNSSNAQPQSQVNIVRLDNNIRKLEQLFAEDAC